MSLTENVTKICDGCGIMVDNTTWHNRGCRDRHRIMKQSGALNKTGCWRAPGSILVWNEVPVDTRHPGSPLVSNPSLNSDAF